MSRMAAGSTSISAQTGAPILSNACPKCSHELRLGDPRPGRYKLKCPNCAVSLAVTVFEESGQPPRIVERAGADDLPGGPKAAAIRSNVEVPSPAGSSSRAEANRDVLETVISTAIGSAGFDDTPSSSAVGASDQRTIAMSLPGAADNAAQRGQATVEMGFDRRASVAAAADQKQTDSEAGFLVAAQKEVAPHDGQAGGIPLSLGGYKVVKELGRGGMGAVYLARQLSLDRDVALKVVAPRWSRDPTILARFTREAYAAAQLVHHNIVQIYDLGAHNDVNYFSMEYVDGQTLAELIRTGGALPPEVAASHILQAARGLKVAHDHGMIHRDIKPENLMLSRHGIVKVADLGLVKTGGDPAADRRLADDGEQPVGPLEDTDDRTDPSANLTQMNRAMGTPSYMAPEQARDASRVGTAADIYSLGCTLYALVTGRPPFQGKTAMEVFTKHAVEPVVPPELLVETVPKGLSEITLKMVAKDPKDRYAAIDEVIVALESFLGIARTAPFLLRPEETEALDKSVDALDSSPSARMQKWVFRGFIFACCAGIFLALVAGRPGLAQIVLGIGVLTPLAYGIVNGIARQTPVYSKVRQFLREGGLSERVAVIACLGLVVLVLLIMHVFWICVFLAVSAAVLATLAFFLINRNLDQERREPLERIQNMLRMARQRGIDEETLRRFIADRCGPRWDALQNAIFGYEAHLVTLGRWGQTEWARARPKLLVCRDAVLSWIEVQLRTRQESRARRYLQHIEELSLKAQGMSFFEARRKARLVTDALVAQAGELRSTSMRATRAAMASLGSEEARLQLVEKLRVAAERPEQILDSMERGLLARRSDESLVALAGPRVRFFTGLVLILGNLIWMLQNSLTDSDVPTQPLWLPLIPSLFTGLFRDLNSAVAGLILVGSALIPGWRISLVAVPAAAVALLGTSFGIPGSLCLVAALLLAALGFIVEGRRASSQLGIDDEI
jgi:eukaryotic-like serine/threonine-protein kinase